MKLETTDVSERIKFEEIPGRESHMLLLPENFLAKEGTPVHFASSLPTFLKLARKEGLAVQVFGEPASPRLLDQRSYEWFAPVLFISSLYTSNHPDAVSIALNMLSNYLTTIFSGLPKGEGRDLARLNIIVQNESTGELKKVSYSGPVNGLQEVEKVVSEILRKRK